MRGIILEDIVRVELLKPTHPRVADFRRRQQHRNTAHLADLWQERAAERARLAALFDGVPLEELLTVDLLVKHYLERFDTYTVDPSCHGCVHLRDDTYQPGGKICWEGRPPGQSWPVRMTTFTPCARHAPRGFQPPKQRCLSWLETVHGIRYSVQRWQGHANDLARQAGTWGFAVGTSYEARVRRWLQADYGADLFLPHRWLVARDRHGVEHWREVDGIERWDASTALVYEIKHHTPAYAKLMGEYVPLLRLAFPALRVVPLEINVGDFYTWRRADDPDYHEVAVLPSLAHRHPDLGYQLVLWDG